MLRIFYSFFLFVLFGVTTPRLCYGDTINADSLRQLLVNNTLEKDEAIVLLQLAETYTKSHKDSGLFYIHQLEQLAKNNSNKKWFLDVLFYKTSFFRHYDQYDSIILYAPQAIQLAKELKDVEIKIASIIHLAYAYDDTGHHNKTIEQYLKGLKYARQQKLATKSILFLNLIGNAYRHHNNDILAIKYLEEAHEKINTLAKKESSDKEVFNLVFGIRINLALAYDMANKREEAIAIFKSLLGTYTTQTRDSSKIYTNIARSYILLQQYDSAQNYLDYGIPLRKRINNLNHTAYAYKEYATLYCETKQYEKSISYGLKVLNIGQKLENIYHVEDAYRNLRNSYFAIQDYKKSAEYGEKLYEIDTQIYNIEQQELVVEMEAKYQAAQKEKEIEQLKLQTLIDKKNKTILIGGIVFLSLLILLIIYILKNVLKKQKMAKQLFTAQLALNQRELENRKHELNQFMAVLKSKNELLEQLKSQLSLHPKHKEAEIETIHRLTKTIILTDQDWQEFKVKFEEVYPTFIAKLKQAEPTITKSELRLSALMKLNLATKEMANILGISPGSVTKTKYRIKKKLAIDESSILEDFVTSL